MPGACEHPVTDPLRIYAWPLGAEINPLDAAPGLDDAIHQARSRQAGVRALDPEVQSLVDGLAQGSATVRPCGGF